MFIQTERIVKAYTAAKSHGEVWANMPLSEILKLEVTEPHLEQAGISLSDLKRACRMFAWGEFFMLTPTEAWRVLCDKLPRVEFSITHLEQPSL